MQTQCETIDCGEYLSHIFTLSLFFFFFWTMNKFQCQGCKRSHLYIESSFWWVCQCVALSARCTMFSLLNIRLHIQHLGLFTTWNDLINFEHSLSEYILYLSACSAFIMSFCCPAPKRLLEVYFPQAVKMENKCSTTMSKANMSIYLHCYLST